MMKENEITMAVIREAVKDYIEVGDEVEVRDRVRDRYDKTIKKRIRRGQVIYMNDYYAAIKLKQIVCCVLYQDIYYHNKLQKVGTSQQA